MLLRDDLLFLDALSAVSRGNNDTFKDVVKLLDGFGQLVRLMSNGNEREVATTQDNSTLFRGFFKIYLYKKRKLLYVQNY